MTLHGQHEWQVRRRIVEELIGNAALYQAITGDQDANSADYVAQSQMNNDGIWGTDVEIAVAATIMQTPIAVFAAFGDRISQIILNQLSNCRRQQRVKIEK
jgi:hypothetical protein